ncbi:hypothetical protein PCE31107_02966 [Pandoraea cepalis]|uniref:Uncharacterized protein n=2 Tax=Pandoraea cepalis TaxID=2508294 RepID=A0A5E4VXK6_9BURK|nr:hypothetical protein PCE31107_02966 [Pandoraea cepalis]
MLYQSLAEAQRKIMNVELTAKKWAAAGQIIAASAIEHMAEAEGITVEQVRLLISSQHEGALRRFKQLITLGINEAFRLHDAGNICMLAE